VAQGGPGRSGLIQPDLDEDHGVARGELGNLGHIDGGDAGQDGYPPTVAWSDNKMMGAPLAGTWMAPVTMPSESQPSSGPASGRAPERRTPMRLDSGPTVQGSARN